MMKRVRIAVAIVCAALIVVAVAAGPAAAAPGSNSDAAHACQHDGWKTMVDPATGQPFKNQGDCVSSAAHSGPASLVVTDTVSANGLGWGFVIGSGLAPNSFFGAGASGDRVAFFLTAPVGADGTVNFGPLWRCGQGLGNFHANATAASGDPISSNTITTSPCG